MIDIHAHIIPSLDDGPKDLKTAIEMAKQAEQNGIKKIIATPHVISGEFDLSKEVILEALSNFTAELRKNNITLELLPGAENYLDLELVKRVKADELMTLNNGNKYILVELPIQSLPPYAEQVFFELKLMGLIPILAHPERNRKLSESPELVYNLLNKGVLLQVNATSVRGAFGKTVARAAQLYLEHNWVHFLATDCHSSGTRGPRLNEAYNIVSNLVGKEKAEELVLINPQKVIDGEDIKVGEIKEYTPDRSIWTKLKTKLFS